MKTFEEIARTIRENAARAAKLDETVNNTPYSKRTEPEIVAAAAEAELLKIENRILHDNARLSYVAEVLPAVVEEFQKFAGKPYGEKTKEKIKDACKARVGCAAYIGYKYSTLELLLVPLDGNGHSGTGMFRYNDLDLRMKNQTVGGDGLKLLEDNKIQPFMADDLGVCDGVEYVEDARTRAELIKIQFAEVKKAWEAYNSACSTFNRLVPSGIEHANPYSAPRRWLT